MLQLQYLFHSCRLGNQPDRNRYNRHAHFCKFLHCCRGCSYIRQHLERASLLIAPTLPNTISNGNRTEWSPIRSVIIRVITKLDDREAGVQFVNHEYDYRPTSDDTKSHYQLIISITISNRKCPITCKCPINALIGGGGGGYDQSDSRKLQYL